MLGQTGAKRAKKAKILRGNITSHLHMLAHVIDYCCVSGVGISTHPHTHTSCKVRALIPFHWISGFIRIALILELIAAGIIL